jgi:hypothetical protein
MLFAVVVAGGVCGWWLRAQALDQAIAGRQSALKSLHLGGGLPPNREVMDYLTTRTVALGKQYQAALELVAPMAVGMEEQADPQLFFQQRFHEVQRTLERLATARGMPVPVQLGFPKELPPPEMVPRLLLQLGLIEDAATHIMAQGISQLTSVKVEDPQAVAPVGEEHEAFLTRLPVRVRLSCSVQVLAKILALGDRARPHIDLQGLHVSTPIESKELEVEVVLARYFVTAPELEPPQAGPPVPAAVKGRRAVD